MCFQYKSKTIFEVKTKVIKRNKNDSWNRNEQINFTFRTNKCFCYSVGDINNEIIHTLFALLMCQFILVLSVTGNSIIQSDRTGKTRNECVQNWTINWKIKISSNLSCIITIVLKKHGFIHERFNIIHGTQFSSSILVNICKFLHRG